MTTLTPKQDKFAQCVAEGMTQADAYRNAFDVKPTTKDSSVQVSASKLMADPKVRQRVEELRAPIVAKVGLTLESHLNDLLKLRNLAAKAGQFSAAISAEVARGKASGVHTERVDHTSSDGSLAPTRIVIEAPQRK